MSTLFRLFLANNAVLGSLCVLWLVNLLVCERVVFWLALKRCAWSVEQRSLSETSDASSSAFTRVAIVADPQLTDERSYRFAPAGSTLLRVIEFHSDAFMRKAFRQLLRQLALDSVVFAGDMLDGARYIPPAAYENSLLRFDWIFERVAPLTSASLPFYNLSGNHDVGWGMWNRPQQPLFAQRYEQRFGALNAVHRIGAFEWVFVSACTSTLPPSSDARLHNATIAFLHAVARRPHTLPRVLMTHVPLYRPVHTDCGPLRSNARPVTIGYGIDYINVLPTHVTSVLLDAVRPVAVYSGDDHDQCFVEHTLHADDRSPFAADDANLPEHTIGTFSWLQGNLWPSVAVVLHRIRAGRAEIHTVICFLPPQMFIYGWYVVCAIATAIACLFSARTSAHSWRLHQLFTRVHCSDLRLLPLARALPALLGVALLMLCVTGALVALLYILFAASV
jgi:hypothetical protein